MKNIIAIVGGGIGGFSVGALLSRQGYKVLLFDKNEIPGGYCQAFKRNNTLIHPAVLRVGSASCAKMIESYCRQAGVQDIEWLQYSEYYQFGTDIKVNQCVENIDQELIKYFPDYAESIKNFFSYIRELYEIMNKVFADNMSIKNLTLEETKKYMPTLNQTAAEMVSDFFGDNKILRDIIMAMLELDDNSVALAIPMTYFEIKGQGNYYVPKGGAFAIINSLRKVILDNGGEVYNKSKVSKIVVENGIAKGVIADDKYYDADIVISGIDINNTYNNLIGEEHIDNKKMLTNLKNKWKISKSCFSVWLGFDCPLDELDIETGSIIYYPNEHKISEIRNVMREQNGTFPDDFWFQLFTSFSVDEKSTPNGKSQISLGILISYDYENTWGINEDYEAVKKRVTKKVLDAFEMMYPKVKGRYSFVVSATPITYEKECENYHGAYLGFEKYQNFVYDRRRHQNQGLLDNLFFSSHWVSIIGGVNGVLQEGIKTANLIMQKYPIEGMEHEEYILFE